VTNEVWALRRRRRKQNQIRRRRPSQTQNQSRIQSQRQRARPSGSAGCSILSMTSDLPMPVGWLRRSPVGVAVAPNADTGLPRRRPSENRGVAIQNTPSRRAIASSRRASCRQGQIQKQNRIRSRIQRQIQRRMQGRPTEVRRGAPDMTTAGSFMTRDGDSSWVRRSQGQAGPRMAGRSATPDTV